MPAPLPHSVAALLRATERPLTVVPTVTTTCKRCGKSELLEGGYTQGRKYAFSCCGLVQMAKAT